ncbi:MAG TPA: hypothetical protein VIK60_04300 [Vicinamibacterales bacterium]
MTDDKQGFVSLRALREKPVDPAHVLAEIRTIYFKTTKQTIQHDLMHAVELLRALPTEEEREKARVYMDGLSQLRSEWESKQRSGRSGKVEKWKKVSEK